MSNTITPRNEEEQAYYDKRLEYYLKYYTSPAVRVRNMTPQQAAEKNATRELQIMQVDNDARDKIHCCSRMQEELKEESLISLFITQNGDECITRVHLISDSGHGGSAEISYCPFCGTKLPEL